ncbi:octopamine receptor beta-1R-like [Oculina patagonica]
MADEETNSSEDGSVKVVAQMVVFTFIIIATVVGNSLICASLAKFRHLRTNTNFILLSLALTDMSMVIIMVLNAVTTVTGEWIFGEWCCRAAASIGLTLSFISILHLCMLSVDRYIAIQKPFRYQFIVTRRRVVTILLLIWVSVVVILNIPLADYDFRADTYGCASPSSQESSRDSPYIFFMVGVFVIIPFAIICFCNAVVFKTAFRQARQLSRVEQSLRESSADICDEDEPQQGAKTVESHSLKREIKSARTFVIVLGIFLLCYTPFYTTGTYRKIAGPVEVPRNVMIITMWIAFANSFCNPIVYGLRYAPFRKAFKKLCSCGAKGFGKRNYRFTYSSSRRERQDTVLSSGFAVKAV